MIPSNLESTGCTSMIPSKSQSLWLLKLTTGNIYIYFSFLFVYQDTEYEANNSLCIKYGYITVTKIVKFFHGTADKGYTFCESDNHISFLQDENNLGQHPIFITDRVARVVRPGTSPQGERCVLYGQRQMALPQIWSVNSLYSILSIFPCVHLVHHIALSVGGVMSKMGMEW